MQSFDALNRLQIPIPYYFLPCLKKQTKQITNPEICHQLVSSSMTQSRRWRGSISSVDPDPGPKSTWHRVSACNCAPLSFRAQAQQNPDQTDDDEWKTPPIFFLFCAKAFAISALIMFLSTVWRQDRLKRKKKNVEKTNHKTFSDICFKGRKHLI